MTESSADARDLFSSPLKFSAVLKKIRLQTIARSIDDRAQKFKI
jgi:hypothetical protein